MMSSTFEDWVIQYANSKPTAPIPVRYPDGTITIVDFCGYCGRQVHAPTCPTLAHPEPPKETI